MDGKSNCARFVSGGGQSSYNLHIFLWWMEVYDWDAQKLRRIADVDQSARKMNWTRVPVDQFNAWQLTQAGKDPSV